MSTIFADKFKNTSGGNNVKVNQLSGIDTAGSITVQGEGTNTTNLQQGLAKHWINLNGQSTPAFRDSFNAGSITDNGTGDYSIAITNNMANGNYNINSGVNSYSGDNDYRFPTFIKATGTNDWSTMATGSYRLQCNQVTNGASTTDPSLINKTIFGDLA